MSDARIEEADDQLTHVLGEIVSYMLDRASDGQLAFSLFIWPDKPGGKVNYVSNVPETERERVVEALNQVLDRWRQS